MTVEEGSTPSSNFLRELKLNSDNNIEMLTLRQIPGIVTSFDRNQWYVVLGIEGDNKL